MAAVATGNTQWSSRFAFIMAAVGSSVGLGNLWRFSAEAGENGGGAFILVYLLAVVLVCIPVLMSEYLVGRAGEANSAPNSVVDLSLRSGVSKGWSSQAWVGMIAAFLIVSFYCVVAAWVMAYIPRFLFGGFDGMDPAAVEAAFGDFIGNPWQVLPWFLAFALLTTFIVSRGVNQGIELAAKVLMPIFFVLLIGLAAYGIISNLGGSTGEAVRFLYAPDFGQLNGEVMAAALGQAFFSVGIGSAIMITYGSYLPRNVSIPNAALTVGLVDTGVALVAGFAIFPIVFALGLDVTAGAGLFFVTLPNAFLQLGAVGNILGAAFFFLAFFAAITSSVSLLEPATAHLSEKTSMSKAKAAWIMGGLMTLVGLGSVFITGFLDGVDAFTGKVMLPLAGLITVLFVGWRLDRVILADQLSGPGEGLGRGLLLLTRYVAPVFVFIVSVVSILDYVNGLQG